MKHELFEISIPDEPDILIDSNANHEPSCTLGGNNFIHQKIWLVDIKYVGVLTLNELDVFHRLWAGGARQAVAQDHHQERLHRLRRRRLAL